MPFFICLYALVISLNTITDSRLQWSKSYRFSDQKGSKSLVYRMAPASYIADIGEYSPPREMCPSVENVPRDLKFSWGLSVKRLLLLSETAVRGISLHWKFFLSQVNKLINFFFALKKSEQAEIVVFNRLLVNYNIQFFLFLSARRPDNSC